MTDAIIETHVTGAEIERLITTKILPPLQDEERGAVIMALLTLTLTLMKEDISAEEVAEGVKGASEWMCLFLANGDQDAPEHEKRLQMN